MDGPLRKLISITYNLLIRMLWPGLQSLDINGTPKILPRPALEAMRLESRGWFLDPEIMIKAHYMGLRVLEFNAFARMAHELQEARSELENRKLIDRAKGILMTTRGLSEAEAYALLRKTAMNEKRKIAEVAQAVITASELLK